jgi:hypothetical protein
VGHERGDLVRRRDPAIVRFDRDAGATGKDVVEVQRPSAVVEGTHDLIRRWPEVIRMGKAHRSPGC